MPSPSRTERLESLLAIALLVVVAAGEATHFSSGQPWPGYVLGVNDLFYVYLPLWTLTALWLAVFAFRRPVLPGVVFAVTALHGLLVCLTQDWRGPLYLGCAAISLVLLALGRREARAIGRIAGSHA